MEGYFNQTIIWEINGIYPQNANLDDLPFESKKLVLKMTNRLFNL